MPPRSFTLKPITEPWLAFLRAVDDQLKEPTEIHCIGGFGVSLFLSTPRPTGDIDFIDVVPARSGRDLVGIAGRDSALAGQYRLFLEQVNVTDPPCDYDQRLLDATPAGFKKLKVTILDPYDLILTKVQRNSPRDRQDVSSLISELELEKGTLRKRFDEELQPYLAVAPDKTIQTFKLWLGEFYSL